MTEETFDQQVSTEEQEDLNQLVREVLEQQGLQELPKTLRDTDLGDRRYLAPDFQVIELRGWKVAEEDLLSSRKKNKDGQAVNDVLKAVTGEDTQKWLIGARSFALIQTKRLSHGDDYTFKCNCTHCSEMIEWTEDLGSLKVQYLQEPGKTEFEWAFPINGKKIRYRLLDGRDEQKISTLFNQNDDSKQSTLMLFRTVAIEGVQVKTLKFYKELESYDATAFREEVDAHDCGVDTTITVECDKCYKSFTMELPMGLDFFLPRKISAKR